MTQAIVVLGRAGLDLPEAEWQHINTFGADGLSARPIRLDHSGWPRLSLMMSV
ncbi:hypothetical protein ACH40F_57065 [Streptomyces sp. NPDC020794]|uniref:hypothetical protein n=1 Tax=unclassified Streptomyces TaxID=2593676 RepID=UPI0036E48BDC